MTDHIRSFDQIKNISDEDTERFLGYISSQFGLTPEELKRHISATDRSVKELVQACFDVYQGEIRDCPEGCYRADCLYTFVPERAKCGECGKLNLQFDDCGFFARYGNRDTKNRKNYLTFCQNCGVPETAER